MRGRERGRGNFTQVPSFSLLTNYRMAFIGKYIIVRLLPMGPTGADNVYFKKRFNALACM